MSPNTDQETLLKEAHRLNPLLVMQPGEKIVCIIKRHPFGLYTIYGVVGTLFLLVIIAVAAAVVLVSNLAAEYVLLLILASLLVAVAAMVYAFTGSIVYNGNRWIVTSDSLTSIRRISLFTRHTSQLSLANLEDVSVDQNGIIQEMFGFGTLRVESAGEHTKFTFPYCPTPNLYARMIIAAHEEFIASNPVEMQNANKPLATVKSFNQPSGNIGGAEQSQG